MYRNVPGLHFFPQYFSASQCHAMIQQSLALYSEIQAQSHATMPAFDASIPQPDFVSSQKHNLNSDEKFLRLKLHDENHRLIQCEHFPRYGEDGHLLSYFRGTDNLPAFMHDFLPSIQNTIDSLSDMEKTLNNHWRLTMNFYQNIQGAVAGFPFHVDIPANGIVTMILNIQREAQFQITDGEQVIDIHLPVGALLMLSGDSRYVWKHRVLPSTSCESSHGEVERISLVLGVK